MGARQNQVGHLSRCMRPPEVVYTHPGVTVLTRCGNSFDWDKLLLCLQCSFAEAERVETEFSKCSHFLVTCLNHIVKRGSFPHCELQYGAFIRLYWRDHAPQKLWMCVLLFTELQAKFIKCMVRKVGICFTIQGSTQQPQEDLKLSCLEQLQNLSIVPVSLPFSVLSGLGASHIRNGLGQLVISVSLLVEFWEQGCGSNGLRILLWVWQVGCLTSLTLFSHA